MKLTSNYQWMHLSPKRAELILIQTMIIPADVKEKILVKLPIKEMVRASILSSKWIDSWTSVPNLEFEAKCTEAALINLVDGVLLVHQGPIKKF